MVTAEATLEASRTPSTSQPAGGWYDPDSCVYQAAADDRTESEPDTGGDEQSTTRDALGRAAMRAAAQRGGW